MRDNKRQLKYNTVIYTLHEIKSDHKNHDY